MSDARLTFPMINLPLIPRQDHKSLR